MHSKLPTRLLMILFISLCAWGCGARTGSLDVSDKPSLASQSLLSFGTNRDRIFVINHTARTLESFTIDPFVHIASVASPFRVVKPLVTGASNGAYFVSLAGNDYAIIQNDGTVQLNPVAVSGDIQSVAFEPKAHFLAVTSSSQSVALLSLSDTGAVTGSFVASGLVDAGKALGASAILSDGRLAIIGGDTELVLVDIGASLREQTLVKTLVKIENASSMGWIHTIPDSEHRLLILDGSRLIVVDIASGAVLDSKSVADTKIIGRYTAYDPHVITQNAGQEAQDVLELSFAGADGKIATRTLRGSPYALHDTWLDVNAMSFAALFEPPRPSNVFGTKDKQNNPKSEIYRYNLLDVSNQIRSDKSEVDSDANVVLMPSYFFVQADSVFGRSERRSYGEQSNSQTIEGYNLQLMRDRFRKP